tara:strand:+ start:403 stop:636 length:234 start_codon:yes stop_codon:yes gene_type:complete
MNNIEKRVKKIMSSVLEVPFETINNTSSSDNIKSWDSLKHMNLVVALEEEFNLVFTDEEITELINTKLIITVLADKF